MADDYTPSEPTVRHSYVVIEARSDLPEARAEFDRFIAKVRRDAAREALDGLAEHIDQIASHFVGFSVGSQKAQDVRDYRETHYPEETP